MSKELEFYINENGIACVPLKMYNDSLEEIERLNKALLDIKSQLEYLETYSSKEDVFEDMKRRLDRIEIIVNKALGSDKE